MIPVNDQFEVSLALEEAAGRAKKLLQKELVYGKKLEDFLRKLGETRELFAQDLIEKDDWDSLLEDVDKHFSELKSELLDSYQLLTEPLTHGDLVPLPDAELDHFLSVDQPAERVISFYEEGVIYLRTPMLPSRNYYAAKATTGGKARQYYRDCTPLYRQSVVCSMGRLMAELPADLTPFERKTIQFLFVYNTRSIGKMLDNDGHDTKAIQDAICGFLPAGDSPLSCRICLDSTVTDDLEEATYVAVFPSKTSVSTEKILQAFLKKYGTFLLS